MFNINLNFFDKTHWKSSPVRQHSIMQASFEYLQVNVVDGHTLAASWMASRLAGFPSTTRPDRVSMLSHSENSDSMPAPTRFVRSWKAARGLVDESAVHIIKGGIKTSSMSQISEFRAPTRCTRDN